MPTTTATTLRMKILPLIAAVVLIAFALTIGLLTYQATTQQKEITLKYTEQLARTQLLAQHGAAALWVRQIGSFARSQPLFLTNIS